MQNFCLQCGRQLFNEGPVCFDCARQTGEPAQPFADPGQPQGYSPYQTRPLDQPPPTTWPMPLVHQPAQQAVQTGGQCPHCGGAGGVYTKTNISTGGFVYMGIMFALTVFFFLIFFPCAIIPFGLLFLGLLFKEKHFACINCGQQVF